MSENSKIEWIANTGANRMKPTQYINRHDREISHIYLTQDKDFNFPLCDRISIWKENYVNNCFSDVADKPQYPVCKHCATKQGATE